MVSSCRGHGTNGVVLARWRPEVLRQLVAQGFAQVGSGEVGRTNFEASTDPPDVSPVTTKRLDHFFSTFPALFRPGRISSNASALAASATDQPTIPLFSEGNVMGEPLPRFSRCSPS
jgi:hypothetical protein